MDHQEEEAMKISMHKVLTHSLLMVSKTILKDNRQKLMESTAKDQVQLLLE